MSVQITSFEDDRRPVLVVSHERSGTHFTMNALAKCFDYVSDPWVDLDQSQININYFAPWMLANTLVRFAGYRPANTFKSHHEFRFFADVVEDVRRAFHLVYVYRNPADTLASYWRLLNTIPWVEGPRAATALDLATAEPMARLMRYQFGQHATMLDRWANHVRGWVDAAQGGGIHLVRYEDLLAGYEGEIRRLGERIGLGPARIEQPSRTENVVVGGGVAFDPAPDADNRAAITELAMRKHPELMARLGYADEPRRELRTGAA